MNWTQKNSASLSHFLATNPLIDELYEASPPLDGNTLEERAMAASGRAEWENCIEKVIQLATAQEKAQEQSPYVQGIDSFDQPAPPKE